MNRHSDGLGSQRFARYGNKPKENESEHLEINPWLSSCCDEL